MLFFKHGYFTEFEGQEYYAAYIPTQQDITLVSNDLISLNREFVVNPGGYLERRIPLKNLSSVYSIRSFALYREARCFIDSILDLRAHVYLEPAIFEVGERLGFERSEPGSWEKLVQ